MTSTEKKENYPPDGVVTTATKSNISSGASKSSGPGPFNAFTSTRATTPGADAEQGVTKRESVKKKQPPFLHREVKINNPHEIDHKIILKTLHGRFEKAYLHWKDRAGAFKIANLIVTVIIVTIQVVQVIVFQLSSIPSPTKTAIATIMPAVTSAALAVQLKLGWGEKAIKCKKSAKLYNQLATHAGYRIAIVEAGGELSDSVKMWNTALISETTEVPPFLSTY